MHAYHIFVLLPILSPDAAFHFLYILTHRRIVLIHFHGSHRPIGITINIELLQFLKLPDQTVAHIAQASDHHSLLGQRSGAFSSWVA